MTVTTLRVTNEKRDTGHKRELEEFLGRKVTVKGDLPDMCT